MSLCVDITRKRDEVMWIQVSRSKASTICALHLPIENRGERQSREMEIQSERERERERWRNEYLGWVAK